MRSSIVLVEIPSPDRWGNPVSGCVVACRVPALTFWFFRTKLAQDRLTDLLGGPYLVGIIALVAPASLVTASIAASSALR